jgi:hypothetical protein
MEALEDLRGLARNELREIAARELKAGGPRVDAVFYLLDALRLFRGKSLQEIQDIIFEIGMLSKYELDINDPKSSPGPADAAGDGTGHRSDAGVRDIGSNLQPFLPPKPQKHHLSLSLIGSVMLIAGNSNPFFVILVRDDFIIGQTLFKMNFIDKFKFCLFVSSDGSVLLRLSKTTLSWGMSAFT